MRVCRQGGWVGGEGRRKKWDAPSSSVHLHTQLGNNGSELWQAILARTMSQCRMSFPTRANEVGLYKEHHGQVSICPTRRPDISFLV